MASLLKPIQKCLLPIKQISKLALSNNVRFLASSSDSKGDKVEKKVADQVADPKGSYFADPWDILYGNERFEIAMKLKGFNDPYDTEAQKLNPNSTKENPNVVYTLEDKRIIGCICAEDVHHVNYMYINKGETKRCECGHWFQCKERELPDLSEFGFGPLKDVHSHH